MAVTAANQTFRCGILPVLLNVPVSFDVVDTDLEIGDAIEIAQAIFNFENELLRSTGFEAVKTKSGLADVFARCVLYRNDSPITSYLDSGLIAISRNLNVLDLLGKKAVPGLPTPTIVGNSNVCITGAGKNFLLRLLLTNDTGAPVTDANASCFVNMQFVPEKSVVKITV
jgi:hypothetical protein